jgi:hypothetical protein
MAISSDQVGGKLIGHWMIDLKPAVNRQVGPAAESAELSAVNPLDGQKLYCMWSPQSNFATKTSLCG